MSKIARKNALKAAQLKVNAGEVNTIDSGDMDTNSTSSGSSSSNDDAIPHNNRTPTSSSSGSPSNSNNNNNTLTKRPLHLLGETSQSWDNLAQRIAAKNSEKNLEKKKDQ